jgi:serine/threonine-protein kinase HipA
MSAKELVALLFGDVAGRVRRAGDRLSFTYEEAWRRRDDVVPLSLSMPLAAATHGHRPTEAYLSGLLPDNDRVLEAWGREFHVSPENAFALLAHVGEDCAGAVQFAAPERVPALIEERPPEIAWQTAEEIGAHLRRLREDPSAWSEARDAGRFSLAGAQRKTARYFDSRRWGVPAGRTPTTHILKPPIPGFDGHVENEHFCLRLARELGLAAAASEVRRFAGEAAIVVTRYDRVRMVDVSARIGSQRRPGAAELRKRARTQPVIRVHQEDMCQALGVHPRSKYQNEEGPSPKDIVKLLREHSGNPDADAMAFVDALIFNWLIVGTDAHAKNYSLLHQQGGRPRLAPLYDLASILPYPEADRDAGRLKLAMKVGSEYRVRNIRRRNWGELADDLGLDADATIARASEMAAQIKPAAAAVRDELLAEGLDNPIIAKLAAEVADRAAVCVRTLGTR